ncbi:MAG: YbhB/YbcL family Raf kinase inhibitor-like protein [Anaerolineales bacterium]|nr:YbhB/YbcL family Raf kinase inhibitor-like protein [Anaerolineales bacterium]
MKQKILALLLIPVLILGCGFAPGNPPPTPANAVVANTEIVPVSSDGIFTLASPEVTEGGALPKEFTCDGASATLPLLWSDVPEGTKSFAVVMHHIPGPDDSHWYWVLYNIPANVTKLEKNTSGIGTLGNNSVNGETKYAPPCSKGPGEKLYTYTIYALSAEPTLSVPASEVSRDVLLDAIKDITLANATLNVTYTR